jgi:hypothetical protein
VAVAASVACYLKTARWINFHNSILRNDSGALLNKAASNLSIQNEASSQLIPMRKG